MAISGKKNTQRKKRTSKPLESTVGLKISAAEPEESPTQPVAQTAEAQTQESAAVPPWHKFPSLRRMLTSTYIVLFVALLAGMLVQTQGLLTPTAPLSDIHVRDGKTYEAFKQLSKRVSDFEKAQGEHKITVVNTTELTQQLSSIQVDIQIGQTRHAREEITSLNHELDQRFSQLNSRIAAAIVGTLNAPSPASGRDIPILLYHHTPPDFEAQLAHLDQAGYTTIDLTQLALGLAGRVSLPNKPAVITFDDGFEDQMSAIDPLIAHHMKATFYIIDGGEASQWCIGSGRRPANCGDAYLSWDQVRALDQNPLFSIVAHTVDHLDLPKQPEEVQRFEIVEGKHQLEAQIGHPVYHFAYPYGSFDNTTIALVKEAGFITATTTIPGIYQTRDGLHTLKRIRTTYDLK